LFTVYNYAELDINTDYSFTVSDAIKKLTEGEAKFDIAFIGIDSENDARTVASAFRKADIKSSLVYHGGSMEGLCRLLAYRPSAYLPNINDTDLITCVALAVYNEQNTGTRCFIIKRRDGNERVPFKEIEYFESQNRKVMIHKTNGELLEFHSTLDIVTDVIRNELNFVRCHQSYIANLDNIRLIDVSNSLFVAKSEKPVFISKRKLMEVKQHVERYNRNNKEIGGRI
jgi:DNA-binding LytR/AlgR family response regulator